MMGKRLDRGIFPIKDQDMNISRALAIQILKYLDKHPDFYFPFFVMCQEYSPEDDDFVEIEPSEWKLIASDKNYKTFQLWENLRNLYEETIYLMSKGFIEKITNDSLENQVSRLADYYNGKRENDLREKTKCEEFVLDEFIDGKATAFSDCLRLIKNFQICSREAKDNLRHFIFLTAEGSTKTPEDMDIDNLQVLATLDGKNKKDAFRKFAVEYGHLINAKFDDVIVMELADKKEYYFSLKDGIYRGT